MLRVYAAVSASLFFVAASPHAFLRLIAAGIGFCVISWIVNAMLVREEQRMRRAYRKTLASLRSKPQPKSDSLLGKREELAPAASDRSLEASPAHARNTG